MQTENRWSELLFSIIMYKCAVQLLSSQFLSRENRTCIVISAPATDAGETGKKSKLFTTFQGFNLHWQQKEQFFGETSWGIEEVRLTMQVYQANVYPYQTLRLCLQIQYRERNHVRVTVFCNFSAVLWSQTGSIFQSSPVGCNNKTWSVSECQHSAAQKVKATSCTARAIHAVKWH